MLLPNGGNLFGFLCIVWSQQIQAQIQVGDGLTSGPFPELDFTPRAVSPPPQIRAWEKPLSRLATSTPKHVQEEAVRALIRRRLPTHKHLFVVKVNSIFTENGKDCFKIVSPRAPNDTRVGIKGTTGVAVAWGLLHYLKYFCGAHVSWDADQLDLPDPLPRALVKIAALDRFRYYQNVCTSSYSFAWWNWARWERHIDWMALNGINFPLAFTAQEEIWRRVYTKFNFTQQELDDHFVGPAFLAWGRMGNIQKWMGPLRDNWHNQTLALQHRILRRMRNLGMIPILPAFAGHVPSAITRIFPEANVTQLLPWGHFTNANYTRTYFLDPQDELFSQIGTAFIEEMRKEFNGTDHFYNCDTFNEMVPPSHAAQYLRSVGKAVFKAMTIADPQAIWVMQGWLFRNKKFWSRAASKALLTSVPQGRLVVLDLASDIIPQYSRLDSYFGQPFIFCMLHDFGGVNGLYGNVEVLLKNMADARLYPNVTLVGTGLTPEGINQNYVIYDLMLELSWRKEQIDITQWAHDYSWRRYGCRCPRLIEAWGILMTTVYNSHMSISLHGDDILIQHRPDFVRKTMMWYKESDLIKVWDLFLSTTNESEICEGLKVFEDNVARAEPHLNTTSHQWEMFTEENQLTTDQEGSGSDDLLQDNSIHLEGSESGDQPLLTQQETFRHDLVDFSRQVLQVLGGKLIEQMRTAYSIRSLHDLNEIGTLLLDLLDDMDLLLGTSKDFLYGSWLHDASTWAANQQEKEEYLSNARYQVTLWGPNGEILDYAVKQWSGIVRDYMKPRYALFFQHLSEALKNDEDFNQDKFNVEVFVTVEKPFADGVNGQSYPSHPQGDLIATVKNIYHKYRHYFNVREFLKLGREKQKVSEKTDDPVWIKYFWKWIINGKVM